MDTCLAKQKPVLLNQAYELFCEHRYQAWQLSTFESAFLAEDSLIAYETVLSKERLCGYLLVRVNADEAEIDDIAICRASRRLGIASMLLKKFIDKMKLIHVNRILLEVNRNNVNAIALYKSFGFTQIGIRKAYYKEAENTFSDAIVMSRQT